MPLRNLPRDDVTFPPATEIARWFPVFYSGAIREARSMQTPNSALPIAQGNTPEGAAGPPGPPVEPREAIVFFDGVCGLCNYWVDFVLTRDRQARFRFSPLQGELARERLHIRPEEPLNSIVLVDSSGICRKSAAVARILRGLPGPWPIAGWLLWVIPRPLRDLGYDFVARNRYRWFGQKEACRLPSPAERERFV
ncbi:MAG: thiol-disulfide oxidoreductase DCC family protein [Planctomycetaceae bacterium]